MRFKKYYKKILPTKGETTRTSNSLQNVVTWKQNENQKLKKLKKKEYCIIYIIVHAVENGVDNTLKKNANNDRVTVENFELLVCRTCTTVLRIFETCGVRLYSVCYIGIRNGTSMCFPGGSNQNIPAWDPSLCYPLLFVTFSHFLPL